MLDFNAELESANIRISEIEKSMIAFQESAGLAAAGISGGGSLAGFGVGSITG